MVAFHHIFYVFATISKYPNKANQLHIILILQY